MVPLAKLHSEYLDRLNIPQENWLKLSTDFGRLFKGAVGTLQELDAFCEHQEKKRRQGAANCHRWLDSASGTTT